MAYRIDILPGQHISDAAANLAAAANAAGHPVVAMFNDIELRAEPGDTVEAIVAAYEREVINRQESYRASPEAVERARANAEEIARLQAEADRLVNSITTLDFTSRRAVLDFLAALQPCSDRIGVTVYGQIVAEAFAAQGLVPNMCVGAEPQDADTFYRWLVGQALDGLTRGPAIHGIFHKFADQWCAKWGNS